MRKAIISIFASGLLVAALAVPAMAGGPADKATGTFTYNVTGKLVEFNAHEAKDNRPAKGELTIWPKGVDYYTVDIDNVTIGPDSACFSGIISADPSGPYADRDGKRQAFAAFDGGEPGAGEDLFQAAGVPSSACPTPGKDVLTGNLQIHSGDSYE